MTYNITNITDIKARVYYVYQLTKQTNDKI